MMLRRSVPGHLDYIDLGPGAASARGVRGTFVVPERAVVEATPEVLAKRERQRANRRAWREAHLEHVRAYDRARKGRA